MLSQFVVVLRHSFLKASGCLLSNTIEVLRYTIFHLLNCLDTLKTCPPDVKNILIVFSFLYYFWRFSIFYSGQFAISNTLITLLVTLVYLLPCKMSLDS